MKTYSTLTAVILSVLALGAQDAERLVNLRPSDTVELSLGRSLDLVGAPKCDGSGNVYARAVSIAGGDHFLAPISEVTLDGKLVGTFSLTQAWPDAVGRGVFVGRNGDVYHLAIASGGVYVVQFAKDGSVKSKTKVETQGFFDPWHLVVYPSSRFLVSGTEGERERAPYTAVFDPDGKLVRRIYEPEDENARRNAESGHSGFAHNAERGNIFVERGDISLGSDGNAYLLHGTSPAVVYAISPSGDVIRKMRIGADSSGLLFRSIESHSGQLAVGFGKFGHVELHVTDLEGSPIATYVLNTDKSSIPQLACYGANGFTIVTTASDGNAQLVITRP